MADIDPLNLDFAKRHPDTFATVLGRAEAEEIDKVVLALPVNLRAAVAARLPSVHVARLLQGDDNDAAEWLARAEFEDAVGLLSRLPRERRLALVNALENPDRKRRLLRLQQYPGHSVGALVGDVPMRIGANADAGDVLAELRTIELDDPGPLVVVDKSGRYVGIVDRWRLLMANPPTGTVRDYVADVAALRPETPIEVAAELPDWHTRNWLPVVDHEQYVLGGVSRARVFTALRDHDGKRRHGGVFGELFADLAHLFGAALDAMLAGRRTQP